MLVPGQQHRGAAGIIVARADAEQAVGIRRGQGVLQPQGVDAYRLAAGGLVAQVDVDQAVLLHPARGGKFQTCAMGRAGEAYAPVGRLVELGRSQVDGVLGAVLYHDHPRRPGADGATARDDLVGQTERVEPVFATEASHGVVAQSKGGVGRDDVFDIAVLGIPPVGVFGCLVFLHEGAGHGPEHPSIGQFHGGLDPIGARVEGRDLHEFLQIEFGDLGDAALRHRLGLIRVEDAVVQRTGLGRSLQIVGISLYQQPRTHRVEASLEGEARGVGRGSGRQ